jgi:hypothetical protein
MGLGILPATGADAIAGAAFISSLGLASSAGLGRLTGEVLLGVPESGLSRGGALSEGAIDSVGLSRGDGLGAGVLDLLGLDLGDGLGLGVAALATSPALKPINAIMRVLDFMEGPFRF